MHKFLFNFSVSFSGGGYKRLQAYAEWFNRYGGAAFIIHPNASELKIKYPNNLYFVVKQSMLQRILNDGCYLKEIIRKYGVPQYYYSYGIPIYTRVAEVNWFHLSNVLPLNLKDIPLSYFDKWKLGYLGRRIKNNFGNAQVISAESQYSLSLVDNEFAATFFVSVNGSDDEINAYNQTDDVEKENIAVVLGTYSYKCLSESIEVFRVLSQRVSTLKLVIIGDANRIPEKIRKQDNVVFTGTLPREEVINLLSKSKFYISNTCIENSYNAASEGIFLVNESYISDIGPHRELVNNMEYDEEYFPQISKKLIHLKKENISPINLKTWDTVIQDMVAHMHKISNH